MHPSNDALSKLSCIQRNNIYTQQVLFEKAKSVYIGDEVDINGPCQSNMIAGYEFEAAVDILFIQRMAPVHKKLDCKMQEIRMAQTTNF